MTILNRYTTTILLSLTLLASQAFAVNTLGANQVTANIATTPAVQATTTLGPLTITSKVGTVGGWKGERVDDGHQQPLLTSADGNNTLGFNIANIVSPHTCDASYSHSRLEFSYICHRNNDNPITYNSVAKDLIASNLFQSVTGGSETELPNPTRVTKHFTGGVNATAGTAQVVDFEPTEANAANIVYKITINAKEYTYTTTGSDSVATIVSNLQTTVNADSVVTCTNQNTKLTCNANVAGTSFTYAASVITSFTIASTNIITIFEGTSDTHTLVANDTTAIFNIIENTSNLFSLNGSTLSFDGAATDLESNVKSYTVKVKASIGTGTDKNTEQTIIVKLGDINDNTPTDIVLSGGNLEAKERDYYLQALDNINVVFLVGNLSAIDADTTDTFTFSLENDTGKFFKIIDDTKLRLIGAIDYEKDKTKSVDVRVTDAAGHEYVETVTITITDINDSLPSYPKLSTLTIVEGTVANTQIATASATDPDANTEFHYDFLDGAPGEFNHDKFSITSDGKLFITEMVDSTVKSSYKIRIRVRDGLLGTPGVHDRSTQFILTVKPILTITSSNTLYANEGVNNTTHTLVANDTEATFSIIEDTSNLFSIDGQTLTFNGTTANFESNTKSYTVKVKASTGIVTGKNAEQIITVNLTDLNDETPTAINLTGNYTIAENTTIGTELGTLSATDADAGDTFTYTSSNTTFTLDNNKLKLNAALDYETSTSLSTTITVTDSNHHSFDKHFTITVTDINDITPSNIQLSTTIIADDATTGTTVATISATDIDTTGETMTYTLSGTDATSFSINGNQLKMAQDVDLDTKSSYSISITVSDGVNTSTAMDFSLSVSQLVITSSATVIATENTEKEINLTTNKSGASFAITGGADKDKFSLSGATLVFEATDFEARADDNTYEVEITASKAGKNNTTQVFVVTLTDLNDESPTDITFINNLNIAENTAANTNLGTLSTIDADAGDTFTYTLVNNTAAYFAIDGNTLKLAKTVDYETTKNLSITIKVTDANLHTFSKSFDFTITNIDDTAPTDIQLSNKTLVKGQAADTLIGTLSANDVDTATLSFSVSDTTSFKIDGNKLKTKISIDTVGNMDINITANDGTNTTTQAFTIAVITDIPDITPVIKQFTVTQGNNQGRVISKTGGVVTVHATVIAETYEWSSVDVTDTSASDDTVFVFDPANTDAGILTITLKAITNTHSSERVLQLELMAESVSNGDDDGDGISNNKDNNTAINKIQVDTGKTITSLTGTRILLGAMGKDSSRLTLTQMQQYIIDNNLPNKSSDTSTTGDIYDYVVEGLSAGATTVVIVELTTAIPANAELRRYSLVTGWANFEVDASNTIHTKTSTTCADNSTWKTGLTTGATCLRLTIKDGGANDTDGDQTDNTGNANGVIASTISIAVPPTTNSSGGGGGGGGCVYNPNAPARFDMGFILLMVLSAYYLIRRKRQFIR
jgi:hypothetical protein